MISPSALRSQSALRRALRAPFRWREPQLVRFDETTELWDSSVPVEWVDRIFAVMALAPRHTFVVSTVFPERMRAYLTHQNTPANIGHAAMRMIGDALALNPKSKLGMGVEFDAGAPVAWPLPNVWLGVRVTHQAEADVRIPLLLHTPAALRFVSCEPLLGPVNLNLGWNNDLARWDSQGRELPLRRIDWVLAGGECGRDARPMHPDWARSLRDQCAAANTPFWFMQWGEWLPISQDAGDWGNRFYRSRRRAGPDENQAVLDEAYGRTCTVPTLCLHNDGGHVQADSVNAFAAGKSPVLAFRAGTNRAGRLLDGIEHNGSPPMR